MPQDPAAAFEYLACSGATSPEILSSQVSELGTGYDLITVSAGGNDVGLSGILNACVFQWNPFRICDDEMKATLNLVRDTLPGNPDKLYAGALAWVCRNFVSDDIKRVFHPQPGGHAVIANLVLWRMVEDNAASIKAAAIAPSGASGCDVPTTAQRPDLPASMLGVNTNCQAAALQCLNCLGRSSASVLTPYASEKGGH
ncbi:hypothetical protein INS49_003261 [Diaporthe citri]|uniref:uncharacterized protein n=1 Tax=Diaporthe citri TaxID=83186 RepID=UPI001C7E2BCB|nr:uncharacterized protein INS49_003261 [Diaporthe citri]KAG6355300.1 hypothetical protein INS49_003261 [Diaporthe citri]